jgi:hypothetical protein
VALEAVTFLWDMLGSPAEGSAESTEEGLKNIAQSAKAKIGKPSLHIYSAVSIISAPSIRVRENLVGLVYFLKLLLGFWLSIAIGMVLES